MVSEPRRIVILGSTGSIGTQTIDVICRAPDQFRVVAIAGGGGKLSQLAQQAIDLNVEAVVIGDASRADDLRGACEEAARRKAEYTSHTAAAPVTMAGPHAISELASWPADLVLNAITGSIGVAPTLVALDAGRIVAVANKESVVAAGPLIKSRAQPGQLVPVDSEHSAIVQCLRAGSAADVRKLVLTASGGPFLGWSDHDLEHVTLEQALQHPTWKMGQTITINSATLVNKGLELIEASVLFDVPCDGIEVVIHPQSVVHSFVEFCDGSSLAQASPPDMRLPISMALNWPRRVPNASPAINWKIAHNWTFTPLGKRESAAVELARTAGNAGGWAPAVFNAANEEAVRHFLADSLSFLGIVDTVTQVVEAIPRQSELGSVEEVHYAEQWARSKVRQVIR